MALGRRHAARRDLGRPHHPRQPATAVRTTHVQTHRVVFEDRRVPVRLAGRRSGLHGPLPGGHHCVRDVARPVVPHDLQPHHRRPGPRGVLATHRHPPQCAVRTVLPHPADLEVGLLARQRCTPLVHRLGCLHRLGWLLPPRCRRGHATSAGGHRACSRRSRADEKLGARGPHRTLPAPCRDPAVPRPRHHPGRSPQRRSQPGRVDGRLRS